MTNNNNKNLIFRNLSPKRSRNISIIYKTEKQFWGISNQGNKKRIAKKEFESLLPIKKLISYKDSKIFKRDIKFTILTNKIEINLNSTRQYVQILNQTSLRNNGTVRFAHSAQASVRSKSSLGTVRFAHSALRFDSFRCSEQVLILQTTQASDASPSEIHFY
jgi:hypothetical protein